jgi:hypothetical protein
LSSVEEVVILARVVGERQVIAATQAMGVSMEELGVETEAVGTAMKRTTERSWAMNQALFTLRRLTYGVSLGLIAAGVEAFKWGFQFDEAMTSARISLIKMLPSQQAVNDELHKLFNIAKFSPFTFKDMTIAFRNMYLGMHTLGISADTVNETMQSVVDTLSAGGRSTPASLNRVTYALQHMAYQGYLTGQVVNQLGRDGIPMNAILQKEFGLTGQQIHNISKLGIPTLVFLQRFNDYVRNNPAINGAARRQAMGSFQGLFQQFRDSMSQIMGAAESGFFHKSITWLQTITDHFNKASNAIGGATNATQIIKAIAPSALPLWTALSKAIGQLWDDFKALIGGLVHNQTIWATITAAFWAIYGVLFLVNPLLRTSQYWLNILIPLWIAYKGALIANAIWTEINAFETAVLSGEFETLTFWQFLAALATGRFALAQKVATAATWLFVAAESAAIWFTGVLEGELAVLAAAVAIAGIPFELIIGLVVLLVAGLVILYFKWKWFHDLVNDTADWIRHHWVYVGAALLGPFWLLVSWIALHFGAVKRFVKEVIDWILRQVDRALGPLKHLWDWVKKLGGWLFSSPHVTDFAAPGAAMAPTHVRYQNMGVATPALGRNAVGVPIIGLPAYRVRKELGNPQFNLQESWNKPKQPVHVDVKINKKVIAQAVAEVELDNLARS